MKKIIFFCLVVIFSVWLSYYLNFGINNTLSDKTDVWGQFGDYVGGVINPILSFITIVLLINSLNLQREANTSLLNETKRQEKMEEFKKFEVRFFNLIESQQANFDKLHIVLNTIDGDDTYVEYKSVSAVSYIEDCVGILKKAGKEKNIIVNWLDEIDADDDFFSIVRRFYLLVKLIETKISDDEKNDSYEVLINLTDVKILCLIGILSVFYEWDNLVYLKSIGVLEIDGIKEYIDSYK